MQFCNKNYDDCDYIYMYTRSSYIETFPFSVGQRAVRVPVMSC